jgi:hypothetical protein
VAPFVATLGNSMVNYWKSAFAVRSFTTFTLIAIVGGIVQTRGSVQAPSGQPLLDVKLGLWEVTTTTGGQNGPQIDTSNMPPEARARIEALRQAQQARGNANPVRTNKSCLTQEKLAKGFYEDPARENVKCVQTIVSSSATQLHVKLDCNAGQANGDLTFVALSRESVKGDMTIVMGGDVARGMTMKSTVTAKWLGADCGDVK